MILYFISDLHLSGTNARFDPRFTNEERHIQRQEEADFYILGIFMTLGIGDDFHSDELVENAPDRHINLNRHCLIFLME